MEISTELLKKELTIAVLESRLEGRTVKQISILIGKSEGYVRGILKSEELQKDLKDAREGLEKETEDVRLREALMRENASEIMLETLQGENGVDKKYDAAKTVWKTQKLQGEVKDATAAFREVFGKPVATTNL
jgi:uncharacterized protein (DUF3084 family)